PRLHGRGRARRRADEHLRQPEAPRGRDPRDRGARPRAGLPRGRHPDAQRPAAVLRPPRGRRPGTLRRPRAVARLVSDVTCNLCGKQNPEGNRFCGMCGSELTKQPAGRERRRVSVLFVDLVSFSTMTHGLDPEELRDLADGVLTAVAAVIEDFDGYVDAFRGDGLIALFGAPHWHPDDPYRAVLAAARALETIERLGRTRGQQLKGRAGVTTGIVIAGSVGSGKVRSYTVMGSAVNLSARLE